MKSMKIEGIYCQLEIGSIGNGGFQDFLKGFENQQILILVDENTHDYCLEYLLTSFPELERAEIILLPNLLQSSAEALLPVSQPCNFLRGWRLPKLALCILSKSMR